MDPIRPIFEKWGRISLLMWLCKPYKIAKKCFKISNALKNALVVEWHISWQENRKQEIHDQEISCRKLGTRKTRKTRKNKGVKNQDLEPKDFYIL